ncbi:MAG: 16S rRNA (uracil(1498)-N(3))-methyltransferase [Chitinivibrionales bacterium]|nr:16S rRNA (uracil(1498)-N(3))-methyltransferase [Chitinivibrionales bacterium]
MNIILIEESDFTGANTVRLAGRRFIHIRQVHQATHGQELAVGLINGATGRGKILNQSPDSIDLQVVLDTVPPSPLPITLCLALPRPKQLKRIVRSVTALGVKRIIIFHSRRVQKSYWQSPVLTNGLLAEYMRAGLEQAKDTILPTIAFKRAFRPFVEDDVPYIIKNSVALIAHPQGRRQCPQSLDKQACLFVGPEGGFIGWEIEKLQQAGCMPVTLGHRILRVEDAVTVFIAKLL